MREHLSMNVDTNGGSRSRVAQLLRAGQRVASRDELLTVGVSSATIGRRVAEGEWLNLLPGVYLLNAGPATFEDKLRAVQLWTAGKAVFSHYTAAYLHGLSQWEPPQLEIILDRSTALRTTPLCRVRRTERVPKPVGNPARTALERTAIDLIAGAPTQAKALEILIRSFQKRMSRAAFLRELQNRPRVRNRIFITKLLEDTPEGVESHMELKYHHDVEAAHGLPRAVRQNWVKLDNGWIRTDVWYEKYQVRIELDGQLAHPGRATDADIMRDNQVLIKRGDITLRYRWPQVHRTPCETAAQVAAALMARGWDGTVTRCSPSCRAPELVSDYLRAAA